MSRHQSFAIAKNGGSRLAITVGLASGLIVASGHEVLAQSVPFQEVINGYTLQGTEVPASQTSENTVGQITGNGASNIPFNVTLTQLSPTSFNYNGTVNGQAVNCTANRTGGNAYSLSGTCGYLTQIFTPTNPQLQIAARQAAVIQTERAQTQQVVDLVGRRIADALSPAGRGEKSAQHADAGETLSVLDSHHGISGVSAGDDELSKALWATYSHSWLSNDWSSLKSRTILNTGVVGGDVKFGGNILTGLTFTYQSSNAVTSFNDGLLDSSTYTFTPYAAIGFLDNMIVVDLMTGYGFGDSTSSRSRSTAQVDGSYSSDRWLVATHVTYTAPVTDWDISAKLGWSLSYDWSDAFTESNGTINGQQASRVGELSLGGRAGYVFYQVEPYLGLALLYDPILGPDNSGLTGASLSRTELNAQLGAIWKANEHLNASVEISNGFLRSNENNTTLVVAGRYSF